MFLLFPHMVFLKIGLERHGHHFFARAAYDKLLATCAILLLKVTLFLVHGKDALQSIVRPKGTEATVEPLVVLLLTRV